MNIELNKTDMDVQNTFIRRMAFHMGEQEKIMDDFRQTNLGSQMSFDDFNELIFVASLESALHL
jgi:hypothetical protein